MTPTPNTARRLTRRTVGEGAAWYVSTRLDPTGLDRLLARALETADVHAPVDAPRGVETALTDGDRGNREKKRERRDEGCAHR